MTQVTQLAMALVANLGLNKPPLKEPVQMMLNLDARGCPIKPFVPSTRTLEERRAVLGCFLLSSVYALEFPRDSESVTDKARVSSYFQRVDALRWNSHLDECLTVLAENKEHPSDALLVQLVKLQIIVERVGQAPWHDEHGNAAGLARAPPTFYLKALQAQLQDFKSQIPTEIQKNGNSTSQSILPDAYKWPYRSITLTALQYRAENTRDRPLESSNRIDWPRHSEARFSLCLSQCDQKLV